MNGWVRWIVLPTAGIGSAAWVGYGWFLWSFQDNMIFPAPGGIERESLDLGAREVGAETLELKAADGTALYAWHYRSHGGGAGERLVMYFPGNAETVAGNIELHRLLVGHDWDVAVLAYRGYPGSTGQPSENGLVLDAEALWEWAVHTGYSPQNIVLHGRSLGGGVAARLAERRNPGALVLESTFRSIRAFANQLAPLHPVDWLLRHPFDTERRAALVGVPTLILHSRDDGLIPVDMSAFAIRDHFAESTSVLTEHWRHADCLTVEDHKSQTAYLTFLESISER